MVLCKDRLGINVTANLEKQRGTVSAPMQSPVFGS
eukprot:COSAG06_NODE_462_length_15394_cov_16.361164_13_plen_35_part_00